MKLIILSIAGSFLLFGARAQDSGQKTAAGASLPQLYAAVEAHPDSLPAHERYIAAFLKSIPGAGFRNMDSVLDLLRPKYEAWMKRFPGSATVAFAMGNAYVNAESPKARPFLLKAVGLDPEMGAAWSDLSQDAERWGDFVKAHDYLKKASEAEPSNPDYAYYYLNTLEAGDPVKYRQMIQDFVRKFSDSERGAQALYWLANRSTDEKEKLSIYEELQQRYSPAKFNWSGSGMMDYFDLLLLKEPEKALTLARDMAGLDLEDYNKKQWNRMVTMAEKVSGAFRAMNDHKPADAAVLLAGVKMNSWSSVKEPMEVLKAQVMDATGNTQGAYDSLLVEYAREPSEEVHKELVLYAAKLGKDTAWVDAGVQSRRESTARYAPVFKLYAYLTRDSVSLADYRGKVVLLTFWFPGCGPCRGEFPHFQTVLNKFKGLDIAYVGINVAPDQDPYVLSFMQSSGYGFTPLRDKDEWSQKAYKVRGEPTNFLIDRQGRIIFSNFMIQNEKAQHMLELMIGSLLSQKA